MAIQTTFKRYEMKYMMTRQQKAQILQAMKPYMKLDDFGHTTIRNIYFDTPDYRLIRRSLEKPAYKEKLRIRSYKPVGPGDKVFVELKKKYDSVVYKRRLTISDRQARFSFECNSPLPVHSQIGDEIEYFRSYYGSLQPAVFLTYEREAFYELSGGDFRVTFDENILFRDFDFSLGSEIYGHPLLDEDMCLMEIKTAGGLPLWMCDALTAAGVYKTSYSKYGTAYQIMVKNHFRLPVIEPTKKLRYA
ncbi:MAG: polyphosphate polymerase domain-containing protein [Lachnospiraceae bacterium]|nr:polyphosphate polymerase domain-containing protein [Lachnospiraceae bacterium]